MKKVSIVLLIIMVFNFIFVNYNVYADAMSMDDYKTLADEGKVKVGGTEQNIELNESDVGAGSSAFGTFLTAMATGCLRIVSNVLCEGDLFLHTESSYSASETRLFTISSLVFNEFALLNPSIYQKIEDPNGGSVPDVADTINKTKEKGIEFSSFFVTVALILSVPMLIWSIIKVIMAKNAPAVAAWKKILVRWALCIFLIIFYRYALVAIDTAVDFTVEGLWNIRLSMEDNGYQGFEATTIEKTLDQYEKSGGVTSLGLAIVFLILVVIQMFFLVKYIGRMFAIMLLSMLAPVIILLHSIYLMLGKESNVLGDFFKNYLALSFMQPLHALFYLIFFFSVSEMAIAVPMVGILLLYAMLRAVSIAKAMFGWEMSTSMFSLK